ncbi:MAG: c-type cytochrome [Deltaproteobacteria bacterium]|nr:c-type cytochrome [Deltaproteobacteria bacterium]
MPPQNFCLRQMRRQIDVEKIRTLMLLILAVSFSLSGLGQAFAQPLFSPTQDPIVGSRIFGAKGCSKCHAIGGVGAKLAPDLGRVSTPRSFYDLAAAMWNHLPQMSKQMQKIRISRPQLSPGETGDLIAFLYTLNYFDRPGDPKAGRGIFDKKHCVACHQIGGTGGVIGPSLDKLTQQGSPIFVAAAMWNHGPAMAEAMRERGIGRPNFSSVELEDLVAYLKSANPGREAERIYLLPGRPDEGQELFVKRRCQECHSIKGRGGKVGGDLAERRVQLGLVQFAAAMWNKAPAMLKKMKERSIPVPQLRAEEMASIVAYLYAVQYFARPGDSRRGENLAKTKGCISCHPIGGKGGNVGPDFRKVEGLDQPATVVSAMWNHASTMEEKMLERSLEWPLLKGGEMADLVTFIQLGGRGR